MDGVAPGSCVGRAGTPPRNALLLSTCWSFRKKEDKCYTTFPPTPISSIHVHLLHDDQAVRIASASIAARRCQLGDGGVSPDLLLGDDLLLQPGGGALGELVVALLPDPLVGLDIVAHHLGRLALLDHADVDVGAGAEVVEDAGLDGLAAHLDGFVPAAVVLPLRLEDGHGGQAAGAHGHVGEFVGGAVGVHGEEPDAGGVDAGHHEVRPDVALVAEEVLLEHRHDGDDARRPAGGKGVEF